MKTIKLTRGKETVVDDLDYEYLSKFKWYFDGKYAARMEKRKHVRMHYVVAGRVEGKQCDHINRNKLDNRRINLRLCSSSENSINRGLLKKDKLGGHKGVYWNKIAKNWVVIIGIKRKSIFGGYYKELNDAIEKYDSLSNQYHHV